MKKILLLISTIICLSAIAQEKAPVNPEFTNYLLKKNAGLIQAYSEDGYPLGEIPSLTKYSFDALAHMQINVPKLDASFDLRTQGGTTPVGSQIASGPCWAFGAIGAIESTLKYTSVGTYDFSEINMSACHGHLWEPCEGGNLNVATNYASRIAGPIDETDQPYPATSQAICDATCGSGDPVYWMQNIVHLPGINDAGYNASVVKQAIYDNGAAYCNMRYVDAFMDYTYDAYYCTHPIDSSTNHGVLLVGWDDDFSKNNFKDTPIDDGAWIVKNSWGTGWGESGYFYISYEDTKALWTVGYFKDPIAYDATASLYHYDEIGLVSGIGYGDGDDYGLVKIVPSADEQITKISTYVRGAGATISIEIYDDFSGGSLSNLLGSLTGQSVTYPGFYTFDLASAINVSSGDDFYVKVRYNIPSETYVIPVECAYGGYADPTIESDVCWFSGSGSSWSEAGASGYDVSIRAYTIPQPETYDVTFSVTDGTDPIENAEVTFGGSPQMTNAVGTTVFAGVGVGSGQSYSVTYAGYNDVNSTVDVVDQDVIENVVMGLSGPTTKLRDDFCGYTTTDKSTWIYCDGVYGSQDFEWEFTCAGIGYSETRSNVHPTKPSRNYIRIYYMPGIQNGQIYDVRVRAKVGGSWGDWGQVCQIDMTGAKSGHTSNNDMIATKTKLYPNPFNNNAKILITDDYSQTFNVYISDITGKILSESLVNANEEYVFGDKLERGVYLFMIFGNNNEYSKTIKFIKQ